MSQLWMSIDQIPRKLEQLDRRVCQPLFAPLFFECLFILFCQAFLTYFLDQLLVFDSNQDGSVNELDVITLILSFDLYNVRQESGSPNGAYWPGICQFWFTYKYRRSSPAYAIEILRACQIGSCGCFCRLVLVTMAS